MSTALAERLGWTFVHLLWQGALIGAVAGLVLTLLRRRGPEARYAAGVLGLGALVLAPVVTFVALGGGPTPFAASTTAARFGAATSDGSLARLLPGLAWFWLIGAATMQARTLVLLVRARRLATRDTTPSPAAWSRRLEHLRDRIGVTRAVRLLQSTRVAGPVVVGWLRPVILVPAEVFSGLSHGQLDAVLAHELAHVRRHDFLINLLQGVAEALLFFHPVVWWLSARVREEREFCCDDLAVRISGDRVAFARGLAALDFLAVGAMHPPAVAANGGPLMKRIERIVRSEPKMPAPGLSAGAPLIVLGALIGLVPAAGDAAESPGVGDEVKKPPAGEVVAEHDSKKAALVSLKKVLGQLPAEEQKAALKLRKLGVSDAELLEMLSKGNSGDVVRKVLAQRQAVHEDHAPLTLEDRIRKKLAEKKAKRAHDEAHADEIALKLHFKAMKEKLTAAVQAGALTEAQAKAKLAHWKEQAVGKYHAANADDARTPTPEDAKKAAQIKRYKEIEHAIFKIEKAARAGEIADADAKAKIKALKEKLGTER